jgi:hypothetical protein
MLQAAETGVVAEYPEIHETFNPRVFAATSDWVSAMQDARLLVALYPQREHRRRRLFN